MHFFPEFVVGGTGGHHREELSEIDLSAAVLVDLGDHLVDCLGLGLNSQGVDGHFEFWNECKRTFGVNGASKVSIEQVEGLLDIHNLFVGYILANIVVVIVGHSK